MSRARVSLWQADYPNSLFGSRAGRKHKILLQLGHYGNVGYKAPGSASSGGLSDKARALSHISNVCNEGGVWALWFLSGEGLWVQKSFVQHF